MKPIAIVYTSNTGFTAEYARMLGERTGWKVCALDVAKNELTQGAPILYMGWLMAGQVKGLKAAQQRFRVCAVCGVGMGATGSQLEDVRRTNALSAATPLFTLQGGFDMKRLRGMYRLMMTVMAGTLGKRIEQKPNRSPDEEGMLRLLKHGGSCVSEENLSGVLDWCAKNE